METYKKWVRKNREFVHSLESLANGATWLLPERFSNSEIGAEAVYSLLGMISAVNQHIIATAPSRIGIVGSVESSSSWSLCISMLKDLETVVEVAAQHFYGDDGKWNFIAATEATKVLVRLALFRESGYKMLLHGGELTNVDKNPNVSEFRHDGMHSLGRHGGVPPEHLHSYNGYGPRNLEGQALFALNKFGENARMVLETMWLNRQQWTTGPPVSVFEKPALSTIWSEKGIFGGLFVTAEVLFIIRPLIYVLFIRKYGVRSWIPWLISLSVDITGTGILSHATSQACSKKRDFFLLSTQEKDEVKRRKLLLALYIMRDPFFTKYARHRLERTEKYLGHVPFLGLLTGKIVELVVGAQTRYTYTSGS